MLKKTAVIMMFFLSTSICYADSVTYGTGPDDDDIYITEETQNHQKENQKENNKENEKDEFDKMMEEFDKKKEPSENKEKGFTSKPFSRTVYYDSVCSYYQGKANQCKKLKKHIQGTPQERDGKKGDYVIISREYVKGWNQSETQKTPIIGTKKEEQFYEYDSQGNPTVDYNQLCEAN